jgi:hypothetical protein
MKDHMKKRRKEGSRGGRKGRKEGGEDDFSMRLSVQ